MSTTCNPRITTGAFTYTESLKYILYKASDPTVPISTQTFAFPHPQRQVTFNAMPRVNLIFKIWRVTGGGDVQVPLTFNFTPDRDDLIYYAPVEVQADTTPGVTSGATGFTFDGTGGKPDWRGRTAYPERVGQGTMQAGVQYSWDGATATFTLLQAGDQLAPGELFNFTFNVVVQQSGTPVQPQLWTSTMVITGTTTLIGADIGKKIIIKGASPYFVITLPTAADIAEGVVTWFEFARASHVNVKLLAVGTTIDWGPNGARTYLTGGVCENLAIYKEPTTGLLRVHSFEGNWLKLGRIISTDDTGPVIECNVQELDGSDMAVATYKRLYEDYVQKLPPSQVVNYTDWAASPTKFSYSNGTNFHVPDRRNMYARATDGSLIPGTYQADKVGPLSLTLPLVQHTASGASIGVTDGPLGGSGSRTFTVSGGSETNPKSFITRNFILI